MLKDVFRGNVATEIIDFVMETCCDCGIPFLMPNYFKKEKLSSLKNFYCLNGHSQHYVGKTEAQKLQEQLDDLQKQKDKENQLWEDRLLDSIAEKQKIEKQLKRLHKGTCSCCKRTFTNLARHMKAKHPELLK